jgi:hypothetical protein
MGALDDLIAQDEKRQGSQLDALIANDSARDMPSQDPEIPTEEPPSFVGYDPSTKQSEADPWAGLKGIASEVMANDQKTRDIGKRANEMDLAENGGVGPVERMAEAAVGGALPGAGKGAGLLKRGLAEGLQAVGMNAGDQVDEHLARPNDERSMGDRARELGFSGLMGSGAGMVAGKVGKMLSGGEDGVMGGISKWAGDRAAEAKNLVSGMGVRDAKAIAAEHGVDAIDDNYGKLLEKYSPSTVFSPKSARDHLAAITPEHEAVGADLRQMQQNMSVDPGDLAQAKGALQQGLQGESARVANALPEDQVQYGNSIDALQQRLGKKPDFASFPELIGEKSGLQSFGHSGAGGTVPEVAQKQAAAYGGGVLKDEVSRIVGQQAPEVGSRYTAQNQNFADLAGLRESLEAKAAAEKNGGDLGGIIGNSMLSAGLGAGAGALATDEGNKTTGVLGGAAAGFAAGMGMQGGATRTAIRQGAGTMLSDMGGNALRAVGKFAGNVGDYIGSNSGAGFAAATSDRRSEAMDKPGAQVAVGHTKIANLLKSDPDKLQGFAPMLQDAASDPQRLAARITNLSAQEPMFRKLVQQLEDEQDSPGPSGLTFDFGGQ